MGPHAHEESLKSRVDLGYWVIYRQRLGGGRGAVIPGGGLRRLGAAAAPGGVSSSV